MSDALSAFASAVNLRNLLLAVGLAGLVLLAGYTMAKHKKNRRKRPGQFLEYEVPGRTAAECRGLLRAPSGQDLFAYTLENAPGGGWYWNLKLHNPTGQALDTLFLLEFLGEEPAVLSVRFVREVFGAPEPVMGENLLDAFFKAKLGAVRRVAGAPAGEGAPPPDS